MADDSIHVQAYISSVLGTESLSIDNYRYSIFENSSTSIFELAKTWYGYDLSAEGFINQSSDIASFGTDNYIAENYDSYSSLYSSDNYEASLINSESSVYSDSIAATKNELVESEYSAERHQDKSIKTPRKDVKCPEYVYWVCSDISGE